MKIRDLILQSENFSTRWVKYFDVYEEVFKNLKEKKITFVEVGVLNGGSLQMWKKYFHPESRIIGIDLNPECKKFESNGMEIFIGDQADETFWENFFKKVGKIDILLDDGGHLSYQQIITTIKAIKNINDEGLLVVEDVHSSYLDKFNNIIRKTFIDFSKKLIDDINKKNPLTNKNLFKFSLNDHIHSIQFFESIVVININKKKTYLNSKFLNKDINHHKVDDFRYKNTFSGKFFWYNKFIKKFNSLKLIKLV